MDNEGQAKEWSEIEKTDFSSIAKDLGSASVTLNSPQKTWIPSSIHAR